MRIISETCIKLEARNPSLYHVMQRATLAVTILFVAGVTGLLGLLWRAIDRQVQDPLMSSVLVGALMVALIASAIRLLTPRRRA